MARINPDIMLLDDGATGAPRVAGPRTDTSQITEEDIYKATRDAGIELGVDSVTLAYEAGLAGDTSKPMNKMTPDERTAFAKGRADKATQARETGDGTEPPYEAPEGTHWSFIGGQWKLYKDFDSSSTLTSSLGSGSSSSLSSSSGSSTDSTKYAADLADAANKAEINAI